MYISNGTYQNELRRNEFLSQSYLCIELVKGLSLAPGLVSNYVTGFRPTVGLQYVVAKPTWTFIVLPRVDLRDTYNAEVFSLLEVKPPLTVTPVLQSAASTLQHRHPAHSS